MAGIVNLEIARSNQSVVVGVSSLALATNGGTDICCSYPTGFHYNKLSVASSGRVSLDVGLKMERRNS